jgi:pyroglutamyl-peptidase
MPPIIIVTGFAPFGGERINPSWEVARNLDGDVIGGLQVKSVRLPVNCLAAVRRVEAAFVRYRPRAILGLGQARGRPALSLERIAINLFQNTRAGRLDARDGGHPVIRNGPDAYFSRLPLGLILGALEKRKVPALISLSAGAYACNAAMYSALHATRRRPNFPAGFIHLPFDAAQSARDPAVPSMPVALMEEAVRAAIAVIGREALPHPQERVRKAS